MRSDWNVLSPNFTIDDTVYRSSGHSLRQHNGQSSTLWYTGSPLDNLRCEFWSRKSGHSFSDFYLRYSEGPANGYGFILSSQPNINVTRFVGGVGTSIGGSGNFSGNSTDNNWHGHRLLIWNEPDYVRIQIFYYEITQWNLTANIFDPIGSAYTLAGGIKWVPRDTFWNANARYDDIKIESLEVTGP